MAQLIIGIWANGDIGQLVSELWDASSRSTILFAHIHVNPRTHCLLRKPPSRELPAQCLLQVQID